MLNDLLVSTGDAPIDGTETVEGFRMKDSGTLVMVKAPSGDPEILAAFGEAMFRNLPMEPSTFNRAYATYLHYLHVMGRRPGDWRRFKIAQGKHIVDRFSR